MQWKHSLWLLTVGLAAVYPAVATAEKGNTPPGGCHEGFMVVEETCYREVVTRRSCRLVPDVKTVKKTVYSYKDVPYCKSACQNPLKCRCGEGQSCPECECTPRTRRVLLKREIVEKKAGFKCVVEEEKERVPYSVYRLVPCDPGKATTPPPADPDR